MKSFSQIRIGCPIWSCPHWRGTVYRATSPRSEWLREYSRIFSTVEGNSTFYGIPKPDTFRRWAGDTEDGFRFVLKFPRAISHELQLIDAERVTDEFLAGVSILHDADRLGPSFLQLAPGFGPDQIDSLGRFLEDLPVQFPWAVEVRHSQFFEAPFEKVLYELLSGLGIDRVIFDSRPLFSAPASDEIESVAQQRKPQIPVRTQTTGTNPILRLIGRNNLSTAQTWIGDWSNKVIEWSELGLSPYIFAHTPDDRFAPEFANMVSSAIPGNSPGIRLPSKKISSSRNQQFLFES